VDRGGHPWQKTAFTGNIQGQAKASALERIVIRREVANQQLLEFYMNVYKDFKAQS